MDQQSATKLPDPGRLRDALEAMDGVVHLLLAGPLEDEARDQVEALAATLGSLVAELGPAPGAGAGERRVLLVMADPLRREALASRLRSLGAGIIEAATAEEALEWGDRGPWALALVAGPLPDLDSSTLARTLRVQTSGALPLWLLSAHGDPGQESRARAAGYRGVLPPSPPDALLARLAGLEPGAAPVATPRAERAPTRTEAPGAGPEAPTGRPRVLVIEDNLVNQKVVFHILRRMNFEVDLAANGREGVDMVEAGGFDLVLMDCQMPVMDGYQATGAIRELPGARSRVPIVALTANAMDGDRQKCLAAGMDDYMSKPAKADQLRDMMERWIPGCTQRLAGEEAVPA